jgi:hypothetical protein
VEVRGGLAPGEPLVVRGSEALQEGARVTVQSGSAEKPAPNAGEADSARRVMVP